VVLADPRLLHADPGLAGGAPDDDALDAAAARIAGTLDPADDVHASGAYRRRLARVLIARALREAAARAAR
jgi:CO/xanthine dehydrogenase FAD-binding subunit